VAIVQSKSGSSATTPLTITLSAPTGAGNSLIVLVVGSGVTANPTTYACTLGGAAGNFVQDTTFGTATDAATGATWRDQPAVAGQTSVAISATGGSGTLAIMATVYEVNDLAASPFDKTAKAVSSPGGTTWTSTATATTTQANERLFGANFTTVGSAFGTITGPSSPWSNIPQVNQAQGTFFSSWITGAQDVAATGAYTYNGTVSPSSQSVTEIVTYKLTAGGAASILPQQAKKRMPAYYTRISSPSRGGVYSR
jgi:hypothetical protein